jgi:hypothetical protein
MRGGHVDEDQGNGYFGEKETHAMIRWTVSLTAVLVVAVVGAPARADLDSPNPNPAIVQANKPPAKPVFTINSVDVVALKFLMRPVVVAPLRLAPPARPAPFPKKRVRPEPGMSIPY